MRLYFGLLKCGVTLYGLCSVCRRVQRVPQGAHCEFKERMTRFAVSKLPSEYFRGKENKLSLCVGYPPSTSREAGLV